MLHDGNAISNFRHHAEIMRDEQHRCALAPLQITDQRQDLRLGGYIKRRCWFIGNQHHGIKRQSHGDHCALALPAGKLMRKGAGGLGGVGDADLGQ